MNYKKFIKEMDNLMMGIGDIADQTVKARHVVQNDGHQLLLLHRVLDDERLGRDDVDIRAIACKVWHATPLLGCGVHLGKDAES